ncbi:12169_t:CDS:2, partial [Dentiscutata erythropus]
KSKYQPTETSIAEDIIDENIPCMFKRRKTIYTDELDIYLRNPTNYEYEFKYLSKMAKDYLSAQATSFSAKRAFLATKELITSRRCNLNPTTIK